jgi:hypothetical protein
MIHKIMLAIQSAERREHIDPSQYRFPGKPQQGAARLCAACYIITASLRRQWEHGRGNCAL